MINVLYHAHCADGFAAATCAYRAINNNTYWAAKGASFQACAYDEKPSQLERLLPRLRKHDQVWVLDFSFPLPLLDQTSALCTLTVLDHHKTALHLKGRSYATIDQTHSGAVLTYDFLYGALDALPELLQWIEWRDLGHMWTQPQDPRSVPAGIAHVLLMQMTPRTFADWNRLIFDTPDLQSTVAWSDAESLYYQNQITAAAIAKSWNTVCLRTTEGEPLSFPAINHPAETLVSDALHELALTTGAPFVGAWWVQDNGSIRWSLRSLPGKADVADISRSMSPTGGGHTQAAGFTTTQPVRFV